MSKLARFFGISFVALFIFIWSISIKPRVAHADVNNFTITNFQADYTLTNKSPAGQLKVKEIIDINFTDFNHGIFRAIPASYMGHNLHVSDINVEKWPFTTSSQNDNLVLKIGDANQTVTGQQQFVINYTLHNVVTFYDDHDELYWDINGDQWQQPFEKVSATFHIPEAYLTKPAALKCFTGEFGQGVKSGQNCTIMVSGQGLIESNILNGLGSFETLSTVISLNKGNFRPLTFQDLVKQNIRTILAIVSLPLFALLFGYARWRRLGKDPKGRGTIVPQYDAPDKLKPAMVGTLVDFKVDNRDISSTIIDLAVRKYLRIIETDKKKLIGSDKKYSLERLNANTAGLLDFEQEIIKGLFDGLKSDKIVELDSLKTKFYKTAEEAVQKIDIHLKVDGYLDKTRFILGKFSGSLFVVITLLAFYVNKTAAIPSFVLGVIILGIFQVFMSKRTEKGVTAREHILGLKLYMQTAEADRLKMMQSPDAPYADRGHAPAKTVDLFEKLLPYAVALGVEKGWADQFKDIYKQPPDWYQGNWQTFNSVYLVSSLGGSVNAMATSFSPPSSSSSSGFGGGGFSGGGGGGGGGGGW